MEAGEWWTEEITWLIGQGTKVEWHTVGDRFDQTFQVGSFSAAGFLRVGGEMSVRGVEGGGGGGEWEFGGVGGDGA